MATQHRLERNGKALEKEGKEVLLSRLVTNSKQAIT
jgi:hypothetical protein